MDHHGVHRKDTVKGLPLRILVLDGGGVRGYSMLILLQELMHRTYVSIHGKAPKRDEIPKPCDHFDLIAGTGTGGLIAIMLGRLRMDVEMCKKTYLRMTRHVFESDKTIHGMPTWLHSTVFKASRLREAIRQCVSEHTVYEYEGNDGSKPKLNMAFRSSSSSSRTGFSGIGGSWSSRTVKQVTGDPGAELYDSREYRTKTAVTATFKGTPENGHPVLLRSYDSRREPPPDFNCKIYEAGLATCATAQFFKPAEAGSHVFLDEGAMPYNPAPQILQEAVQNEWPGRQIGCFVSLGTGKRTKEQRKQGEHQDWLQDLVFGAFVEAKRRMIRKIDECEKTHDDMLRIHLPKYKVPLENYFRLNVEDVGGFALNEWSRLGDMDASTRRYLAADSSREAVDSATDRLSSIYRSQMRDRKRVLHTPSTSAPITENEQFNPSSYSEQFADQFSTSYASISPPQSRKSPLSFKDTHLHSSRPTSIESITEEGPPLPPKDPLEEKAEWEERPLAPEPLHISRHHNTSPTKFAPARTESPPVLNQSRVSFGEPELDSFRTYQSSSKTPISRQQSHRPTHSQSRPLPYPIDDYNEPPEKEHNTYYSHADDDYDYPAERQKQRHGNASRPLPYPVDDNEGSTRLSSPRPFGLPSQAFLPYPVTEDYDRHRYQQEEEPFVNKSRRRFSNNVSPVSEEEMVQVRPGLGFGNRNSPHPRHSEDNNENRPPPPPPSGSRQRGPVFIEE